MPTAYGDTTSELGRAKFAAARAVGLDANANWGMIEKAQKAQQSLRAAQQRVQQSQRRAAAAKKERDLQINKQRNEGNLASQYANKSQTAESKINADEQNEREEMVRTFKSRRKGRAALRINIGNGYGSAYEGSSGISISL
jgi:hypothetical protein